MKKHLLNPKRLIQFSLSLFLILVSNYISWGQQTIGSYPVMDGGFEAQAVGTLPITAVASVVNTTWTYGTDGTSSIATTSPRSGSKYAAVNVTTTSVGRQLISPQHTSVLTSGNKYIIQYYSRNAVNMSIIPLGVGATGGGYVNSTINTTSTWTKVIVPVTSSAANLATSYGAFRTKAAGAGTAGFHVDDFVIYDGTAVDGTAPEAATAAATPVSGTTVSWTAASGGVDGGGYMVVRYSTNPNPNNDPNQNGIYGVGNTITNGTDSLVGTVVYLGTGTSFIDAVAGSVSGSDYYKIYTVDKAFNYALEIIATAVVSSTPTITSSAETLTGFNYTGAGPSASQSFVVSGSNLTSNLGVSTASTDFELSADDFATAGSSSISLPSPTVASKTLYVRLKANLLGGLKTATVTIASTGANTLPTLSLSGSVQAVYYYNGSGLVSSNTSWGANSDGTGANPIAVTDTYANFVIANGNATTNASWTLGSNSKVIVGNGSAVTLTVANGFPITGTIDAATNGSVVWQDATPAIVGPPAINYSPTFGTLDANSEVHFQPAAVASYSPSATTFGKLFIDSPASGSVNLSNVQTVATSLSVVAGSILILPTQATHVIYINSGATVTIDGTVRSIKKTGIFSFNNATANTTAGTAIQFKDSGSTLTLSATSTIDYSSINGTQTISALPSGISYTNLTLSENSTNITSSSIKAFPALTITGTLTINTPGNVTYASSTTGAGSITLGNGATIVRTLGTLNAAPLYSGTYNVTYNGKLTTVAAANTTMASTTVTLTSANATIVAGMNVTGTAVASGTTVASISGTSLVLSQNATLTATAVALTFEKAIAQTTGVELPSAASNALNNLTINNAAGVILNSDTAVDNDLTLGVGSALTIPTGKNLTVDNAIVNNGTITIENNANLVQTAVANNNSGSGTATVKRNSASIQLYDYTLWSSPVTGQDLRTFSNSTLATRFYTYNSASNLYNVVDFTNALNFTPATGYLIRAPNDHLTTPTVWNGVFTGIPNNGNQGLSLLTPEKFYATGNPYPSTISADLFLTGNTTGGTLYFWRKTNNALTSSYATYTLAGGTGTGTANSGDPLILTPNGTIQVGQGFIVKTGLLATTLNFTNAMRTANNDNQFLRTTNEKSRYWLNLTSTTGAFCQTMVAYMPQATSGVDNAIDGRYFNDAPIALTSIINTEEYTIQGRALPFATTDTVPLGFKTNAVGNYTIAIDHVDGLFSSGQTVFLRDNLLNTVVDLSAGSYSFTSAIGTFNSRFEVVYQSTLAVTNPTFTANSVIAYSANGEIRINSGSTIIERVRVYDLQGRLLVEKNQVNATETKLSTTAKNQVLLVEITAANGSKITKKIIQ